MKTDQIDDFGENDQIGNDDHTHVKIDILFDLIYETSLVISSHISSH